MIHPLKEDYTARRPMDGQRNSTPPLVGSNPTVPAKWIRTSERLPEKRGKYACVVYFKSRYHGKKTRAAYRAVKWLEFYDGVFWLANGAPTDMILWWMPLPNLPSLADCMEIVFKRGGSTSNGASTK